MKKKTRTVVGIVLVLVMMFALCSVAFATSDADIFSRAESIASGLYGKIIGISSAVAGVCLVIALCMWAFGNKQQSQAGWEWAKRILIAYVAIMSVTLILKTVGNLGGFGSNVDVSSLEQAGT